MQLILLERVEGLGNVGSEVSVKPGFARNYLLPQNKAIVANEGNRKVFERRRAVLEAKHHNELEKAQAQAAAMADVELSVVRATSDGTHLYGSVSEHDIVALLAELGHEVLRRNVLLEEHIKVVGEHNFQLRLHPDVVAEMRITVAAENM
jgi:large subunit ribosomal protein L9